MIDTGTVFSPIGRAGSFAGAAAAVTMIRAGFGADESRADEIAGMYCS
ncbi:hypothetical protein Pd630_LPD16057 (plasmid) [Rhodococcus opacus PD630]|nr:hypothetical protein Pd630_LPD16057 [Rhodococcus opacus PD630]